MAHFDWYAATVPAYPRVVTDALVSELPGASSLSHGRGRHGYHHAANILSATGDTIATVLHGGHNQEPHALASGANAGPFADLMRRHWPDTHRVSRLDSAEDIHGEFPAILAACRVVGDTLGVKGMLYAPDDPEDGATYYLGATTSATRFRCYEKGKQVRASAEAPESVRTDWVRLEVQWRPVKEARLTAAQLTPGQAWGVAAFTRQIASDVLLRAPERVQVRERLRTTEARRDAALVRQYGAHLQALYRRAGSDPSAFGALLCDLIGVGADA